MKKTFKTLLLIVVCFTCLKVNAKTYDICKNGCTYDNAQDVFYELQFSTVEEDVIILFKDNGVYHVDFDASFGTYGNQNQIITGYSKNPYITNMTIKSEDPKNRATLESGQNQFSFEYDNAENFIVENMIMKNLETDHRDHGGDMFFVQEKNIYLKNSDFYTQDTFAFWSLYGEVKDCYFYSENGVYLESSNNRSSKLVVDNIKVNTVSENGYFSLYSSEIDAKNIYVETINKYGCAIYSTNANIDNINIKGATISGMLISYFDKSNPNKVLINNSDISNNELSLMARFFNFGDQYDIKISNSKLNGVDTSLSDWLIKNNPDNRSAPIVYVDSTNTWTKPIKRGENVIEENDGKVIIDLNNSLTINKDNFKKSDLDLKNIFSNIEGFDFNEATWTSSNPEVAIVENGNIKILKVGTTTITGEYNDNNYSIQLKVTENIINPKTGGFKIPFIALFIIVSFVGVISIFKNNKKMEV